jgi:hypothetical protein
LPGGAISVNLTVPRRQAGREPARQVDDRGRDLARLGRHSGIGQSQPDQGQRSY